MGDWNPEANNLFLKALDRPSGPTRDAFVDEACRDDERLKTEVIALLTANERSGDFLESPAEEFHAHTTELGTEQLGSFVGPYELVQELGEGGMGVVFRAEQTEPVRRAVALKIVKPGMDSRQVAARFEAERQALALMEHANIARVIDAGTTEVGRPYFVMELVEGLPITAYCEEHKLTVRQRLELFIPVCRAVQHAHQKGIIHRDLKPSNVLVALYDGLPVPKVIDFGVSKAVGPKLTAQTLHTELGAVIGTVEYMSPEQAELNPLDVDTRSDIYSLGVILYELLAGSTPLDRSRLKGTPVIEQLRMVRDEAAPRPSSRLDSATNSDVVASNRGTEAPKLRAVLRGELDWIVLKALEKDRNRRYPTASALADDIEHYLAGEPVSACPPSAAYRFRVFVRRNRIAVTASAIVLASLLIATGVSLWHAAAARRAEALAEQRLATEKQAREDASMTNELMIKMLQSASPASSKGIEYTVRQMLDDFSMTLGDELKDQPVAEVAIRKTMAASYLRLERIDKAKKQAEAALDVYRKKLGTDNPEYADCLVLYADITYRFDPSTAEKLIRESIDIKRRLSVAENEMMNALAVLLEILRASGRREEEQRTYEQLLAIKAEHPRDYEYIAMASNAKLEQAFDVGDWEQGEKIARETVARLHAGHMDHNPVMGTTLYNLGITLLKQGKVDEASKFYRQGLDIFLEHYQEYDVPVLTLSNQLLNVAKQKGDTKAFDEFRSRAEKALEFPNADNSILAIAAETFAKLEEWGKVEECYMRAADVAPLASAHMRYFAGLLQLRRGDHNAYRKTCLTAFTEHEKNQMPVAHYLVAWACCLGPDCGVSGDQIVQRAKQAVSVAPSDKRYQHAVAIALYRAGKYDEARQALLEIIKADSTDTTRSLQLIYSQLFLSMTEFQLNHVEDAKQRLLESKRGLDRYCEEHKLASTEQLDWLPRFTVKLWKDEATNLIAPLGHHESATAAPKD